MLINFEELKEKRQVELHEVIDFSKKPVDDALIKRIKNTDINVSAYIIEPTDVHISIDVEFEVDYLDARTLEDLELNFTLQEEVLFTTDLQRAEELEIDHFTDEFELLDLIWELILVTVPYNYSEAKAGVTGTEEDLDQQTPFANIFNK